MRIREFVNVLRGSVIMRGVSSLTAAAVLSLAFVSPASAQSISPPAPKYDDKEKLKLAEIAKRPEVIATIDAAWADIQRQDKEFAFHVNSTAGGGDWRANPQWLDVWQKYGRLYDNPILVNYLNALGQRLVPPDSPHLYAFRLMLDPTPTAEALSTGTIDVSTGLVSLLDNEAQLAYVLAHEIAHVERNHMYEQVRNQILEEALDRELEASKQKKRAIIGAGLAIGGGLLGAKLGGGVGAAVGVAAAVAGTTILFRNKFEPTRWEELHESQADEAALNAVLSQRFDLREVPKVYTRLAGLVAKDKRVGLGFMGNEDRVKQRRMYVESQIGGPLKSKIDAGLGGKGLTGSSAEFAVLMAALKRDNGVIAMEYDLMPMAKENFIDAEKLRSNDPRVQYELGRAVLDYGQDRGRETVGNHSSAECHSLRFWPWEFSRAAPPVCAPAHCPEQSRIAKGDPGIAEALRDALPAGAWRSTSQQHAHHLRLHADGW